jgi:hypothetical protein
MKTIPNLEKTIIEKAKELGASLAGIARIEDLKASKSYELYEMRPFYEAYEPDSDMYYQFEGYKWQEEHKSVLVWALEHPATEPVLDWWSMKVPGFTPGNRVMRSQSFGSPGRPWNNWQTQFIGYARVWNPAQIERNFHGS